jgi:stage V sporulation protein SpoVS
MICKKCQIAGDLVAEARKMNDVPIFTIDNVTVHQAVRSVAYVFHGLCKGPGHCDCQHKVDFEGKTIRT